MTTEPAGEELVATVDVRDLQTVRWGPIRQLFPKFVEEIELGRYLKRLLRAHPSQAVRIQPHRELDGRPSSHVFDVFRVQRSA